MGKSEEEKDRRIEEKERRIREYLDWSRKNDDKISWVREAGREMETIEVGMTRRDLETVFMEDGGMQGMTNGFYVYRYCPYFKVYVKFRMHNDERGEGGRLIHPYHPDDIIVEIKGPYVVPRFGGA
jgi:hypothetical protein